MTIDYISAAVAPSDFKEMFMNYSILPGQQAQKFNNLMIQGFAHNGIIVHAISHRPLSRQYHKKLFYSSKTRTDNNVIYDYISVFNIPFLKNVWQFLVTFFRVMSDCRRKDYVVLIDILNVSAGFAATLAARIMNRTCIGIATDIPEYLSISKNKTYMRLYRYIFQNCTGYVFLTEQMNNDYNITNKPSIVIEGLCDISIDKSVKSCITRPRKCLYAGYLAKRYGINFLVEGFIDASVPDSELHIYGNGPYVEELKDITRTNKNIIYHGSVFNEEVVKAEKDACLLINPRPSKQDFTKYSFPSKIMEYMSTGTLVLATVLPGMPKEYLKYIEPIYDESVAGLSDSIKKVLEFSDEDIIQRGNRARDFIINNKNNQIQAKKVIDFITKIETSNRKTI